MTTQVPMMISVLPIRDQTIVMVSQVGVRPACNARLTALSPLSPSSGPSMSLPIPTITSQRTMAGSSARTTTSRSASPIVGLVSSST